MTQFCIYASKFVWIVNVWSSIRRLTQVPENPDILKKKKKTKKMHFCMIFKKYFNNGKMQFGRKWLKECDRVKIDFVRIDRLFGSIRWRFALQLSYRWYDHLY